MTIRADHARSGLMQSIEGPAHLLRQIFVCKQALYRHPPSTVLNHKVAEHLWLEVFQRAGVAVGQLDLPVQLRLLLLRPALSVASTLWGL